MIRSAITSVSVVFLIREGTYIHPNVVINPICFTVNQMGYFKFREGKQLGSLVTSGALYN